MKLTIDPERTRLIAETGIYVRAQDERGKFGAYDIAHLDRESLVQFIQSRGENNLEWATGIILALLGHGDAS